MECAEDEIPRFRYENLIEIEYLCAVKHSLEKTMELLFRPISKRREIIIIRAVITVCLSVVFLSSLQGQVCTMQTAYGVGEQIYLSVKADGAVTAEGLEPTTINTDGQYTPYKLVSQSIQISGNISELECAGNKITALDIAQMSYITKLNCAGNLLSQLDLAHNRQLRHLNISENQFESISVAQCKELEQLVCKKNQLRSLDVSSNTKLKVLQCDKNQLASLNVASNPLLETLECYENKLQALDVLANTSLEILSCNQNEITSLNLKNNTKLIKLACYRNPLGTLNLSANEALQELTCSNNDLSDIDLSRNVDLHYLDLDDNKLTRLSLSNNTKLEELYCNGNPLATIDLSHNPQISKLFVARCNLSQLDVSHNENIAFLGCSKNKISSLTFGNLPKVITLSLERNCISNKEMTRIASQLKDCKGSDISSEIYVIDTQFIPSGDDATGPNYPEHNQCSKATVELLKGKGWTVQNRNNDLVEEYEGDEIAESSCEVLNSTPRVIPSVVNAYIELQNAPTHSYYSIYSLDGHKLLEGDTGDSKKEIIEVSSLPSGAYFFLVNGYILRFYVTH